jgi:hypothetical protein
VNWKRIAWIVYGTLALCCGILGCMILWEAYETAKIVHEEAPALLKAYTNLPLAAKGDLAAFTKLLGADLKAVETMVNGANTATQQLQTVVTAQLASLKAPSDALAMLVTNTDRSLNAADGLLPAATASTKQAGDLIAKLSEDEGDFALMLARSAVAMKNLADITGDPALKETVEKLALISANAAIVSDNAAKISDDLRGYVHHAVQPMSKARLAYALISEAFPLIARALP